MAEAFGVATGAISIVSLALELSKVVKSTYRSVKLMQDVFANTAEIEIAFSTVEQLLNEIGRLSQSAANDCGVVVCLEQCRPRLQALKNIVQDIRESDSTNKGKIKKAFRALSYDHKISEASRLLNETVASLSLGLSVLQL